MATVAKYRVQIRVTCDGCGAEGFVEAEDSMPAVTYKALCPAGFISMIFGKREIAVCEECAQRAVLFVNGRSIPLIERSAPPHAGE